MLKYPTLLVMSTMMLIGVTGCDFVDLPQAAQKEAQEGPAYETIKLDPSITYQTIAGWEATSQAGQGSAQNYPRWKDRVMDMAVDDLGLNRLRLEVRSGMENPVDYYTPTLSDPDAYDAWKINRYLSINDDADPFNINAAGFQFAELDDTIEQIVLPFKQRVEANGETPYINLNYVSFNRDENVHRPDAQEYAEFIVAAFRHIQNKYGFTPDAVEIILEPDQAGWSARDIAKAIVATGRTLEAEGFGTPDFIAPSTTSMAKAIDYIDEMVEEPGLLDYLTDLSYHRYRGVSKSNLKALADRAAEHGLRTSMLEWIGADHKTLYQDLTIGNASSWQQFTLAFPTDDNGAQYIIIDNVEDAVPSLKFGDRTRYLRQYFRYVRPGARRIQATRMDSFSPVAFVNPDGKYVVVVDAEGEGLVKVEGLPPGNYGVTYTTGRDTNVSLDDMNVAGSNSLLTASMPDAGVMTVYGK